MDELHNHINDLNFNVLNELIVVVNPQKNRCPTALADSAAIPYYRYAGIHWRMQIYSILMINQTI
jgi:hypothetical protein